MKHNTQRVFFSHTGMQSSPALSPIAEPCLWLHRVKKKKKTRQNKSTIKDSGICTNTTEHSYTGAENLTRKNMQQSPR